MAAAAAAAAAEGRTVLSVHQILSNHWPLYFPQTPIFAEDDTRVLVIRAFAQFLNNEGRPLWREVRQRRQLPARPANGARAQAVLRDEHSIQFDYQSLVSLCPLADLPVAVRDHPEDTIACLGLALCVVSEARRGAARRGCAAAGSACLLRSAAAAEQDCGHGDMHPDAARAAVQPAAADAAGGDQEPLYWYAGAACAARRAPLPG